MGGSMLLLGLFMTGGVMLVMAVCLYVITDYRRLRQRVLERFSGTHAATTAPAPAPRRPAPLRINDPAAPRGTVGGTLPRRQLWHEHRRLILIGALTLCSVILPVGIGLLQIGFWWSLLACAVALAAAAALLPRWHQRKLQGEIEASVPDALDIAVRSLRIGIPISVVIRTLAEDTPGLLGAEFAFTADQINFGKDTTQALEELAQRCDNQTLRFLAAAVAIQNETGGNLASLVEKLATLARARIRLRRKIDSITAEAKWSGVFLSGFPIVASGGIWLLAPDYFVPMKGHHLTVPILTAVVILLVFNLLFMRRIVRFDT